MKRFIPIVAMAAAAVLAVSATPAFTADQGTVNMTIAVASPCITVSPQNIAFPGSTFSPSVESPSKSEAGNRVDVTNCSESSESLFISATDASGSLGASWTLGTPGTIDINRYGLLVGTQPATKSNQPIGSPLTAGNIRRDPLMLYMPLAGSSGSGQTMSMSLTYTATF